MTESNAMRDDAKDDDSKLDRRLRRRVTAILILGGFIVAAAIVYRRTPHPEAWDASGEPVGVAPRFTEVWRGEPVARPRFVVPSPSDKSLIVFREGSGDVLRCDLDGVELGKFRCSDGYDPKLRRIIMAQMGSLRGARINFTAADASGRFVAFGVLDAIFVLDLLRGAVLEPTPTAIEADTMIRSDALKRLPPARSVFRTEDGSPVVVLCTDGIFDYELEVYAGDDRPRGRRLRAAPCGGWRHQYDLEIFEAETGSYVARRLRFSPPSEDAFGNRWTVDADKGLLAVVRKGVVEVLVLGDDAAEPFILGDGDVTAIAATASGFATGHRDGVVRRWQGRVAERVAVVPGGEVNRLCANGDRLVAISSGADPANKRAMALVYGRQIEFGCDGFPPDPITRTERWLYYSAGHMGRAVGPRGAFDLPGQPILAVADWVAVDMLNATDIYDMSGSEPRQIARVPGRSAAPLAVRAFEEEFQFADGGSSSIGLSTSGALHSRSWETEGDLRQGAESSRRAPRRLPGDAPTTMRLAFSADELHEVPETRLLAAFLPSGDLATYDPKSGPDAQLRIRKLDRSCTGARALASPKGDRFVVPSWDLDELRFGEFSRGLTANAAAPLVGPKRGELRKDKLHDGEIDGKLGLGARFAFVENDVVAVCEPDGVRLRHVPTGRELARLADSAEALCVSTDRSTIALVKGAEVRVFQRR